MEFIIIFLMARMIFARQFQTSLTCLPLELVCAECALYTLVTQAPTCKYNNEFPMEFIIIFLMARMIFARQFSH